MLQITGSYKICLCKLSDQYSLLQVQGFWTREFYMDFVLALSGPAFQPVVGGESSLRVGGGAKSPSVTYDDAT